jgi:(4S)-4-hydroxy-5-phosphonooxypentane-2,3-dione isomerase
MYVITVLFSIHPAHRLAFLDAINSNAKTSLADEAGCRQFDVCTSSSNPDEVFLYEVYDSKEAFDVHLASKHFLAFNALTATWVTAKVVTAFDRIYSNLNHK